MFESLTERLGGVFDRLTRRGSLSAADVEAALREIRVALLEADVALPVARSLVEKVRERAVGQETLRSVAPGQQVVKIVNDCLIDMLGGETSEIALSGNPPLAVLMVGLQGSGKTTTTAKLGLHLRTRERRKVLMASVDIHRPAAQQQLAQLGERCAVATLPVIPGETADAIAGRAMGTARREGYDVVLIDTAGRLTVDEAMMAEAEAVRDAVRPVETLLVADAMTGQDAVATAGAFHGRIGITGIVLTRIDGDARGGAALSMRAVTDRPIKFVGTGEKLEALEPFHPERTASRILGQGDVVSLVERAAESIGREDAERLQAKLRKGRFDLDDMLTQFRQMRRMGGAGGLMAMLPQVAQVKARLGDAGITERMMTRQEAIILSMTPRERERPEIIKASRKKRIAEGSGTAVQDVNRLLKQFQKLQTVMKRFGKMNPADLAKLEAMAKQQGMLPPG